MPNKHKYSKPLKKIYSDFDKQSHKLNVYI